jgi:hypothetical protein
MDIVGYKCERSIKMVCQLRYAMLVDMYEDNRQVRQFVCLKMGKIPHDLNTSTGVARWAYQQAEFCGAALWDGRNTLIPADSTWKQALEFQR